MRSYITGTIEILRQPFDGSGNFTRSFPAGGWQGDAAAGIKILASRHDTHDADLAAGLSNVICKDGQSSPTANIGFNGKKITNLANPTDPQDAATKSYADNIRNFATGITLTGAAPEARIGFTDADIGFGARKADAGATPPTYDRFVWNDKPDLSGVDRLIFIPGTDGNNLHGCNSATPGLDTTNFWHGTDYKGPVIALRGLNHASNPGGIEFLTNNNGTLLIAATLAKNGAFNGGGVWTNSTCTFVNAFNGYIRFANGVLIQWGLDNGSAGDHAINFPTAFSSCLGVYVQPHGGIPADSLLAYTTDQFGLTAFVVRPRFQTGTTTGVATQAFHWLAIGHNL